MITLTERPKLPSSVERAARGAALLDERAPDWWQRIDAASLQIASCSKCVLGQLFGVYFEGLKAIDLEQTEAASHGFAWCADDLEEAWREQIAARRVKTLVPA